MSKRLNQAVLLSIMFVGGFGGCLFGVTAMQYPQHWVIFGVPAVAAFLLFACAFYFMGEQS